MKRIDLLRAIRRAASVAEIGFVLKRQGRDHELWLCGQTEIVIPRHREINELTARGVLKDLEHELGKGWWR